MILSDRSIKELLKKKILKIEGLKAQSIQSASIDLRLGAEFSFLKYWSNKNILDLKSDPEYHEIKDNSFVVPPHQFVLGVTEEKIELPPHITAFLEGRSTIGRMGLFIQNAGWVAPGFKGKIVLELYNANTMPIRLFSGRRICQIVLCELDQPPENIYQGKYQNQEGLTGAKASQDFENQ